ncbi:PAS domain-containing sensor histidine kinase [Brevibacillus parabrevis]|uniref:PAS domain-containing sensor histidine kinase n=1 Tax=Brevibacillus parabrevis TaxID=54914 RepID=UPI0007AC2BFC|nr:PAS domain-containing sensor histidine kinase [Brevibacillus parabrevis]KZE55317.1 PAS domain-containing sensor histidine kinase [Brevibacillus parabrevis]
MIPIGSSHFALSLTLVIGWIPLSVFLLYLYPNKINLWSFCFLNLLYALMLVLQFFRMYSQMREKDGRKQEEITRMRIELDETKELLDALLQQTPDAVSIVGRDGKFIHVNKASVEQFGYSASDLLGNAIPCVPAEHIAEMERCHSAVLNGKSIVSYETVRVHKNGSQMHVSLSYGPVLDNAGKVKGIICCSRDITERKRMEQALQDSQAHFRLITENMSEMIYVVKRDGTVAYVSHAHTTFLGYSSEDMIGIGPAVIDKIIHPEDQKKVSDLFRLSWRKEEEASGIYRLRHSQGHWVNVESRFKPVSNSDGVVDSMLIVSRDVSEITKTKELLRQSDKLSAIGQLAAGIAHEIRNPLTSLRGFIQLLNASITGVQRNYCQIMLSELDRINLIVSELLVLAKPQAVSFQQKDLSVMIHNVLSLLESQANLKNIQMYASTEKAMPPIACEENQIKQVLLNICKNAMEALPDGGEIYVQSQRISEEHIQVSIQDNGCGIDPERIPRLGEPFYTTKENGTGLGLMVSQRILEDHGGSLHIESEKGRGTTANILLPVCVPSVHQV